MSSAVDRNKKVCNPTRLNDKSEGVCVMYIYMYIQQNNVEFAFVPMYF